MRRIIGTLLLLGLAAAPAAGTAWGRAAPDSFADLAEKLMPAVVNIATTQIIQNQPMPPIPDLPENAPFREFFEEFFKQRGLGGEGITRSVTSLGSGFIVDKAGYVVTNHHVIAEATEIAVVLNDDTRLMAEIVGRDEKTDLALLKVVADHDLPFVTFGDSDAVRVGDWVLAIGNPFGFGNTVTAGIISASRRDINAGPYDDFLQTDAPINRGNSGGPLFNLDGEVIGVNTAIFSPSGGSIGIGFATPSAIAAHVVEQLKDLGRVRRGWLGVRVQSVDEDIAEAFGLPEPTGALVASVAEGGPAAASGIEVGDVIVTFDGKPIRSMRELPRVVAQTDVGKSVQVEVVHEGQRKTVAVVLGELPEKETTVASVESGEPVEPEAEAPLGLRLAPLSDTVRETYGIGANVTGVAVAGLEPDSPAAAAGIAEGDVITEIDQRTVSEPGDVGTAVTAARAEGKKKLVVLIDRQGDPRFVAVDLGEGAD
jgi:serine protease Do